MLPQADHRPRLKRPRVRLACLTCRERKTRCDGRQPVCKACETRGVGRICTYDPQQRSRWRSPTENVDELSEIPYTAQDSENTASGAIQSALPLPHQRIGHENPRNVPPIDALATVPTYTDLDDLYGPSSSIDFTRRAFQNSETANTSSSGARPTPADLSSHLDRLWERNEADATLPRRRIADEYVRGYWNFLHPVFPIVHKPTISKQYEALWRSDIDLEADSETTIEMEETTFLATMNLIFALGSKLSEMVELSARSKIADGFYQKSRKINNLEVLDSSSLQSVQLLLLTAVYLQSSDRVERCWNVLGLAIRAAQGLGLHTENNLTVMPPQPVLEMRRRVWYNCVSLDRSEQPSHGP